MKLLKPLLLLAIGIPFLAIGKVTAQTFTVLKATRQRWSGGVAGHYGVNYYIELETTSKAIRPDTVWINGAEYPIDYSGKNGNNIRSVDSVTHKIKFNISEGESHMDFPHPPNMPKDTTTKQSKPIRHFDDAAVVSYMVKHKQHFFHIKTFTNISPLNYP